MSTSRQVSGLAVCFHDLRLYGDLEIKVADPVVEFCETVVALWLSLAMGSCLHVAAQLCCVT